MNEEIKKIETELQALWTTLTDFVNEILKDGLEGRSDSAISYMQIALETCIELDSLIKKWKEVKQ